MVVEHKRKFELVKDKPNYRERYNTRTGSLRLRRVTTTGRVINTIIVNANDAMSKESECYVQTQYERSFYDSMSIPGPGVNEATGVYFAGVSKRSKLWGVGVTWSACRRILAFKHKMRLVIKERLVWLKRVIPVDSVLNIVLSYMRDGKCIYSKK